MTLPAFLSSSYQQYKEDQKVFTTWLYQAAKACGYKSATDTAREAALRAPKLVSRACGVGQDRALCALASGCGLLFKLDA